MFDGVVDVPWKRISIDGPCRITITNHGPEVIVVDEPTSDASRHTARWIVPNSTFGGQLPPALCCNERRDRTAIDHFSFHLPALCAYSMSFRADNLFSSIDVFEKEHAGRENASAQKGQDYQRRRGEINLVCGAQANVSGFPQGLVRSYVSDPPDIVIMPVLSPASNAGIDERCRYGVGVEVSELIDQSQHQMFLHAQATVRAAVEQWRNEVTSDAGAHIRLDYRITRDLIARLKSGSGPKDKRRITDEAVRIIDSSVREFRHRGAVGTVDSGLIPYVWNPDKRTDGPIEVIAVMVSASSEWDREDRYCFPVSGVHWSRGRFFNTLGEDVTLDAERLQELVSRKAPKIRRRFPQGHPFSSLVLYLTGGHFPTGSGKSGSFGILHVGDEHPDRRRLFEIGPFSQIYINHESSYYMIDGKSGRFTNIPAS